LKVARKALKRGIEINIVAEITGFTLEIIKSLKNNE